ncbi:hypothetical protein Cgig2_026367 [Carnegiea gigantea]|uniref:CRM domain-containing protein n=1 Tax=Carnegiea gigantea TaxID=171969 RepID=A0A9Q1KCG1_9CARY|nr:hypothetical protein Cgig2_026367 [Carnegiea gigantea]
MFISLISRQNRTYLLSSPATATATATATAFSLSSLLIRHHFTAPTTTCSSRLHSKYSFTPPPSLHPQNRNPKPNSEPQKKTTRKKKPPYRPPSSLDTGEKPLRSKLPFDFRYSYTESSPSVRPIGLREPKYSPFGPGRLDREWTGFCAPVKSPKVRSVDAEVEDEDPKLEERRRVMREKLLGESLTEAERKILVDKRRDGLTHNMLNDIHNHWKHAEAIRIKCMGVPTIDMENVCTQLEDKTFGKIIHRQSGLLVLYRGRNYKPKKRPVIPLMLWKPHEPVYPKLIRSTIQGLSIEETKAMRKRGLAVPALTKLARNGYYGDLMSMVRDAFLVEELVRIDCSKLDKSDCKKIGVKLRDLVPCILVTFMKEQIVVWRGKDYKPQEGGFFIPERASYEKSDDNDLLWGT